MAKYGRGLNREIVGAVNKNIIKEPLTTSTVRKYAESMGWNIPDTYIDTALANGSNPSHSMTYAKYFDSLGGGQYKLRSQYRGKKYF